jgi:hypothetical protein
VKLTTHPHLLPRYKDEWSFTFMTHFAKTAASLLDRNLNTFLVLRQASLSCLLATFEYKVGWSLLHTWDITKQGTARDCCCRTARPSSAHALVSIEMLLIPTRFAVLCTHIMDGHAEKNSSCKETSYLTLHGGRLAGRLSIPQFIHPSVSPSFIRSLVCSFIDVSTKPQPIHHVIRS